MASASAPKNRRTESRITREMHKSMMQTPDNWPAWPVLPLKRTIKLENGFYTKELGTLVACEGILTTVFLCNMWDPRLHETSTFQELIDSEIPRIVYADYDTLLDDYWEVD